jgi:gamma-butyrobetaine dioxygenase
VGGEHGGAGWLELPARGGRPLRFPAAWLRGNCPCDACRDPVTGQRPLDLAGIPDATVASCSAGATAVTVTFGPDGHQAAFGWPWLEAHALDEPAPPDARTEDAKALWDGGPAALPSADWADYQADDTVRAGILAAVVRHGAAVLRGVPAEPGMVARVAATLGYVRETNYGRLFDVRAEPSPRNLAYTSREIGPHTDNPYRDPVPTLQLLHCLRDAAEGGDTLLVDGFAAAARLRGEAPGSFAVLSRTPWPFRYADECAELRTAAPLIGLDPRGRIREVRFNSRSMEPLRGPAEEVAAAYAAYLAWARLLRRERAVTTRLAPGDCLIVDNTRVLHARTAFTVPAVPASETAARGGRHLQGCSADLDGLASTLAVLRRGLAS